MSNNTLKVCIIENCTNDNSKLRFKRNLCNTHYKKWLDKNSVGLQIERMKPRPAIIDGNIAKIPLGVNAKDGYTIVDKEFAYLADEYRFLITDTGYSATTINSKRIKLHHLLIGKPQKGYVIDHINRDKLDNRLLNLRHVPFAKNIHNAKGQPNRSGYKGVAHVNATGKWRAYIKPFGKQIHLGQFITKEEAARVYDEAAKKYWGEYAYLNFPDDIINV